MPEGQPISFEQLIMQKARKQSGKFNPCVNCEVFRTWRMFCHYAGATSALIDLHRENPEALLEYLKPFISGNGFDNSCTIAPLVQDETQQVIQQLELIISARKSNLE